MSSPPRVTFGLVARGPLAVGVVAIGTVAIGIVAIGGISIGVVSVGAVALGGLAIGALSAGWVAVGALAFGIAGTVGGLRALGLAMGLPTLGRPRVPSPTRPTRASRTESRQG